MKAVEHFPPSCLTNKKFCACSPMIALEVASKARKALESRETGKHLLGTQNVSEQNQKHLLCPGHKICVHNKCCARGQTGKYLCRQQCVRNYVSSFVRAGRLMELRVCCFYPCLSSLSITLRVSSRFHIISLVSFTFYILRSGEPR